MRASLLLLCSLCLWGCSPPVEPLIGLKEVWVDRPDGKSQLVLPFPLSPEAEEQVYVSLRSLGEGRGESERKRLSLLDGVAPVDSQSDAPEMLLSPARAVDLRTSSGIYVGHSVFKVGPGNGMIHHLRLLLISREARTLRIPADGINLRVAATGIDEEEVRASSADRIAFANRKGERSGALIVLPKEDGLCHVFFRARRLGRALLLSFRAEEIVPLEGPGAGREPEVWNLQVRLARRYVISEGIITVLEQKVALDFELPPESEDPSYYPEPRVAPVGG